MVETTHTHFSDDTNQDLWVYLVSDTQTRDLLESSTTYYYPPPTGTSTPV